MRTDVLALDRVGFASRTRSRLSFSATRPDALDAEFAVFGLQRQRPSSRSSMRTCVRCVFRSIFASAHAAAR